MKKTLLKFSSFVYLTSFRRFSKANYWEINLNDLTVLCDCTEKEAIFACKDFRAVVLQPTEETAAITKIGDVSFPKVTYRLTS